MFLLKAIPTRFFKLFVVICRSKYRVFFLKKVNNFLCVKLTQGLLPHPLLQGRPLAGRPAGLRRRRLLRDGGQDGGGGNRAQGGEEEEEGGHALKDIRMVNSGILLELWKKVLGEKKCFRFRYRGDFGATEAEFRQVGDTSRQKSEMLRIVFFFSGPPWVDSWARIPSWWRLF